jgi:hypothetical protein
MRGCFRLSFFGSVALLSVSHAIACGWPKFSLGAKFDAVVLLLLLAASPLFDIVNEGVARAGKERKRFESSLLVYIVATLAIMLFAHPSRRCPFQG